MIRWLTILCGAETLLWGFWLGAPWWEVFPVSEAFHWMAGFAPEWLWGLFMMGLGSTQLYFAIHWRQPRARAALALLSMLCWTLIVLAFALGNWRSTATPAYLFFVAAQALIYVDAMTVWLRRANGNGQGTG